MTETARDDAASSEPTAASELEVDELPADDSVPTLCVHTKRRAWGRALRVQNRDGRVAYQFEDGELRVIAPTHEHLLERARMPAAEAIAIARDLRSVAGLTVGAGAPDAVGKAPLIGVAQQVALFRDDYPDGFADAKWKKDVRGEGATKPRKQHRDQAIALAGATLSANELDALIETSSGAEIITRIGSVLSLTDLVTTAEAGQFTRLTAVDAVAIGTTLREVLVGDRVLALSMQQLTDTMTRAMGGGLRWQLVTALPALIDPLSFPWVRPAAIREQSKSIMPALRLPRNASGVLYSHVCQMVRRVGQKLADEGMAPQDLMDVTDFTWATLRPTSRKRLAKLLALREDQAPPEPRVHDIKSTPSTGAS